jgi:hypothetical protein
LDEVHASGKASRSVRAKARARVKVGVRAPEVRVKVVLRVGGWVNAGLRVAM